MLRRAVWQTFTDVSEVLAASIVMTMSDDGGSKHLWNVGRILPTVHRNIPEDSHLHTRRCENLKSHDLNCVPISISMSALMMETACTSETSVNVYQTTRRYNPEDRHLHTRRRENLKSYFNLYTVHGVR
jgi:hypothetical protein